MHILQKLNPFRRRKSRGDASRAADISGIFRFKYDCFKELLDSNAELSRIFADIEQKLRGHDTFGMSYVRSQSTRAVFHTLRMVKSLDALSGHRYAVLSGILDDINAKIKGEIEARKEVPVMELVLPYSRITKEMVDWVGGKSANLGEVYTRVGLPMPEGFAITTRAYESFLRANDLVDEINKKIMEVDPNTPETINLVSEDIQRLIISAPLPPELEEAIRSAYDLMAQRIREKEDTPAEYSLRVSMRSSAIGEDSELSFAGQYLSLLNVGPERLSQSYRFIVASLYTPRAISYRLSKGIRDEDIAMSVACLRMVESVASGVMYTHHPFHILDDNILISAVWGLGPYAVDGHITPDAYTVARGDDLAVVSTRISNKPVQLVSKAEGGLAEIAVPVEMRDRACLSPEQIKVLAGYGRALEEHYRCPQDVEWALDRRGRILILQTRPLRAAAVERDGLKECISVLDRYRVLVENGAVAFPGVGCGPVFHADSEDDLVNFPEGAVLVAKHSSPKFVIVMQKARAIVTDSGSVTGHMASLVREFAVPTVLGAGGATSIPSGTEVTVDAYSGRVYEGRVPELLALQTTRESHMQGTPVLDVLERVSKWILPLHLVDPKSPDFTPESCRSLHDIMRLVHELSYTEMFRISDLFSDSGGWTVRLDAPIPLDLYMIDLGGGLLRPDEHKKKVTPEGIGSTPFKALLRGMLHEDLRCTRPRPVELRGFLSVMSEQMLSNPYTAERFGDRSYAIISDKYLNFSSRVGYHYSVLDAYCGRTVNKNYITFSFKGGAADDVRKNRRARAIALILKELDFSVDAVGDRVDARFLKYECLAVENRLEMVGRLLLFTRQMDMLMDSEASVQAMAKSFLEGNYHFEDSHPSNGPSQPAT